MTLDNRAVQSILDSFGRLDSDYSDETKTFGPALIVNYLHILYFFRL